METKFFVRATQGLKLTPFRQVRTRVSSSKHLQQQVNPIGDYYASILESSTPTIAKKSPTTSKPISAPTIETKSVDSAPGPSILFSSRLSSPLEWRSEIQKKSVLVAGIWVPPRPNEPDNCCMSGCVNCVWDRYGEEVEEWAAAKKQADHELQKERRLEQGKKRRRQSPGISGTGMMLGEGEKGVQHTMVSMDDDRGGSESNLGTGLETDLTSDELFKCVPVGIREFMKQEKKLKEKHRRDGTSGG